VNDLAAETLTPIALASLRADARGLIRSSTTGQAATYQAVSLRAYNASAGTVGYTEAATSCTVWIGPLIERDVQAAGDGAKLGDVRILVAADEVATPAVDDRITVGANTYAVYRVELAPLTTIHSLLCRRGVN